MYLYRYEDTRGVFTCTPRLLKFKVLSGTPCGAWVQWAMAWNTDKKFVNLKVRKKFACITKIEALEIYLWRKKRHAEILRARLKDVENAHLRAAELLQEMGGQLNGQEISYCSATFQVPGVRSRLL